MNLVIVVAGVAGLAVAAFFLVELIVDAVRRRQYLDVGLALAVAAFTIWLLFTYGDALLQ